MEMVRITGGCYMMGDQPDDGKANERPVHEVCVDDFYLGRYEVTQQQRLKIMGDNASELRSDGQYPVGKVSWQEAVSFTKALSGLTGNYRLPTEEEWEYAARSGGLQQKFSGGDDAEPVAWHKGNSAGQSHPVGQKQANGLGLYDMSGNVYEWCSNVFSNADHQQPSNQKSTGAAAKTKRSRRGGGWGDRSFYSRTSARTGSDPENYQHEKVGFRLALTAPEWPGKDF